MTFADAIHFVDLFNYFMGACPTRVTAHVQDFLGRGMDDESLIGMEYPRPKGPVWATVETGYHSPGKFREVTVIGDELSAICDFNVAKYKIKTFQNKHVPPGADYKAVEGEMRQLEFSPRNPCRRSCAPLLTRSRPGKRRWPTPGPDMRLSACWKRR